MVFLISRFIQFFCRISLTGDEWNSSEVREVKVDLRSKSWSWTIEQRILIETSSVDLSLRSSPKSHSFELSKSSFRSYLSLKWYDNYFQCAFFASFVDSVSHQTRPRSALRIFFAVSRRRRFAPPLLTALPVTDPVSFYELIRSPHCSTFPAIFNRDSNWPAEFLQHRELWTWKSNVTFSFKYGTSHI